MKLIIGNMTNKLKDFIKNNQFNDRIMVINKMCNVKAIKSNVDIIVPFAKIEKNGLITNTMVHFEELLMSVNAKSIKYGNFLGKELFEEVSKKYNINCEYLDLNDSNRLKLI